MESIARGEREKRKNQCRKRRRKAAAQEVLHDGDLLTGFSEWMRVAGINMCTTQVRRMARVDVRDGTPTTVNFRLRKAKLRPKQTFAREVAHRCVKP